MRSAIEVLMYKVELSTLSIKEDTKNLSILRVSVSP